MKEKCFACGRTDKWQLICEFVNFIGEEMETYQCECGHLQAIKKIDNGGEK